MSNHPPYTLSRTLETRWLNPENPTGARGVGGQAGCGRKGAPCRGELKAGETWLLGEGQGMGTIRRLWFTVSDWVPEVLRGVVLRLWWDGAERPAVEAPLADFCGNPHGRRHLFANLWFNNPENRNWNCTVPMPFRTGFRIEVANESPRDVRMFWYHIDYTLGDRHDQDTGYFHAHWNRENPTTLRRDFRILPPVQGRGRYLGCSLGLITRPYYRAWWGEGEVKIYLDGDTEFPTLCGTGTEDYICTAWGTGSYSLPEYGCHFLKVADADRQQISMYRLHDSDPIFFQREIRVEMQQIGYWGGQGTIDQLAATGQPGIVPAASDGTGFIPIDRLLADKPALSLFERQDDWCATAYFYLDRPESALPAIAPYAERVADLTGEPEPLDEAIATVENAIATLPSPDALATMAHGQGQTRDQLASRILRLLDTLDKACQVKDGTQALLAAAPGNPKGTLLTQLLATLDSSGRLAPDYAARLRELEREALALTGCAGIVRTFRMSPLQQRAADIATVALPSPGLLTLTAPFDPGSELGDIRPAHQGRDGLVYLEGEIDLPEAFDGALAYGADGPLRVWVNDVPVDCRPNATNPAVIGEYDVPVRWRQGVNRVLFALNTNQGKAWGVVARVMKKTATA